MKRIVLIGTLLLLAACGRSAGLKAAPGEAPVPPSYGQTETPDTGDLLTPPIQSRPLRGDELLKQSDKRRSDQFDLPPR